MSIETLSNTVQRLITSMDVLAALGADIHARHRDLPVDPQVQDRLRAVTHAIDPKLFDGVRTEQEMHVLNTIRSALGFALDLLENPQRAPQWNGVDIALIQSTGRQSRRVVHAIDMFASRREALKQTLQEPGAFLDIGTGAGWLAIEAAQSWPALRTVGIDAWDAALDLARNNIAASGLNGRIELRRQRVEDLVDREAFTLVWLPAPFLAREIVPIAIQRAYAALRPDGWMVFGLFGGGNDPLGRAVAALKTQRCGGHPWTTLEVEERLRRIGLVNIEASPPESPTVFVAGKRPSRTGSAK